MTYTKTHLLPMAATAALLLPLAAPTHAAEIRVQTRVVETSTDVTPLPTSTPGTMTVRACHSCTPQILRLDEMTLFNAGNESVTLQQLRAACGQATTLLAVSYDPKTKLIKQLFANCTVARTRTTR